MAKRDLEVRDAVERWLDSLRSQRSEQTISTYWYRLKLFVEWAEDEDHIETMQDIDGWDLDSYETHRRSITPNANTLKNELTTLKSFLEYCQRIEIVDGDLAEKIDPPKVPKAAQSSNIKLAAEDATALLEFYRDDPGMFGSRQHALLELLWHTAARIGEIRGLDVGDMHEVPEEGEHYIAFRNRPESGTRIKKGDDGERPVLISEAVHDAIEHYKSQYRQDVTDEYGRAPLITSSQGRPAKTTLRQWCYKATIPCHHSPCPHGNEKPTCEYTEYNKTSGCPSSRSPHQIRTGAITWMRDSGLSEEVVAGRVNASVETIREHYDKQDPVEEMWNRRAADTGGLDITQQGDTNDQ